jgi:L-rhamnose mutarotase
MEDGGLKTYCLTLDLHDDPGPIEEYKRHHRSGNMWPKVVENILSQGIFREEIYLAGARMVMVLRTTDEFSISAMVDSNQADPEILKWEELMWKYQKPVPGAKPGEKWVLMDKIFEIEKPG